MKSVHVYPSTFEYESRILKVTKTLVEKTAVDRVTVIALAREGLARHADIDDAREVLRVGARLKGRNFLIRTLAFLEWSLRIIWALRQWHIDIVNCHSLSVLPLCVALKFFHRAILVYEPHELETETATFTGFRKTAAKWVERLLIRYAAATIVVSESIRRYYTDEYRLDDVVTVMNVPERETNLETARSPILRQQFGIPNDQLVFMYQGALEEERGTGLLLKAFQTLPERFHIVFMGFGSLENDIRTSAKTHPNIHFHAAVPPAEVIKFTLGADIGFALLDGSCRNHECALPNKLFHYIHAGLPVIVSDLPEMGDLVDRWQCGWRATNTVQSIARCITKLDSRDLEVAGEGARRCREELVWEREAEKLVRLYGRILHPPKQAGLLQSNVGV